VQRPRSPSSIADRLAIAVRCRADRSDVFATSLVANFATPQAAPLLNHKATRPVDQFRSARQLRISVRPTRLMVWASALHLTTIRRGNGIRNRRRDGVRSEIPSAWQTRVSGSCRGSGDARPYDTEHRCRSLEQCCAARSSGNRGQSSQNCEQNALHKGNRAGFGWSGDWRSGRALRPTRVSISGPEIDHLG
jgi:hypothetical protein